MKAFMSPCRNKRPHFNINHYAFWDLCWLWSPSLLPKYCSYILWFSTYICVMSEIDLHCFLLVSLLQLWFSLSVEWNLHFDSQDTHVLLQRDLASPSSGSIVCTFWQMSWILLCVGLVPWCVDNIITCFMSGCIEESNMVEDVWNLNLSEKPSRDCFTVLRKAGLFPVSVS